MEAVQKASEFSKELEGACAELNAHATELAMDLEQQSGWKLPDSWHRWNKRDHSPEQIWGVPLLERLRDAFALAEVLGEAEKGSPPALMLAYRLAERIREHKHDPLYQSQDALARAQSVGGAQ